MKKIFLFFLLAILLFLFTNCDSDTANPITNVVTDTITDTVITLDTIPILVYDSVYIVVGSNDTIIYDFITEADYVENIIDFYMIGGADTNQKYVMGGYYTLNDDFTISSNTFDFFNWLQKIDSKEIRQYSYNNDKISQIKYINYRDGDTLNYVIYDSLRNITKEIVRVKSEGSDNYDSITANANYVLSYNSEKQISQQIILNSNNQPIDTLNFNYSSDLPSDLPSGHNFDNNFIKRTPAIENYLMDSTASYQVLKFHSNNMLAEDHQFDSNNNILASRYFSIEGYLTGWSFFANEGAHSYTQIRVLNEIPFIIYKQNL